MHGHVASMSQSSSDNLVAEHVMGADKLLVQPVGYRHGSHPKLGQIAEFLLAALSQGG